MSPLHQISEFEPCQHDTWTLGCKGCIRRATDRIAELEAENERYFHAATQPDPTQDLKDPKGGEDCKRCGRSNVVWFAPSPLWNAVIRGGSIDGEPKFDDLVCAACFMQLAEEQGIATRFRVFAEEVNVDLETITPSGRVWDEDRWLWIGPNDATRGTQPSDGDLKDRMERELPEALTPLAQTPALAQLVIAAIEVAREEGHQDLKDKLLGEVAVEAAAKAWLLVLAGPGHPATPTELTAARRGLVAALNEATDPASEGGGSSAGSPGTGQGISADSAEAHLPSATPPGAASTSDQGAERARWEGVANIAWCPEHGLHGARDTCFECGKPVEQIPMLEVGRLGEVRGALRALVKGPSRPPESVERAEGLIDQARDLAQEALTALDCTSHLPVGETEAVGGLDNREWTLFERRADGSLEVQGPGLEEESVSVMLVSTCEDALAKNGDRVERMEKALMVAAALTGARASGQAVSPAIAREVNAQILASLDSSQPPTESSSSGDQQ